MRARWPRRLLAFAIVLLAVGIPRVVALDRLSVVDEATWLVRSANFAQALSRGDFANTFQREHPGVTIMWAGMAGHLWRFPEYLRTDAGQVDRYTYVGIVEETGHSVLEMLVAGKLLMVLANTAALVLAWVYGRRVLGRLPAFLGLLLIAFDPFHAAHTRLLHLDGLLSCLLLLALLAFLSFTQVRRLSDLIVSGIAAGLGWLTKSPGFFLAPAIVLLSAIGTWGHGASRGAARPASRLWQFAWPLLLWGLVAVVVLVILWPAMWVDSVGTVSRVFTQALAYASEGHESTLFFNGRLYPDGEIGTPAFYPIGYLWRSTPIVLAGIVAACVAYVVRREPFTLSTTRRAAGGLLLFVVVFTVLQNVGTKKFDRYLLPVFPALDLVAAMGWVAVASWLRSLCFAPARRYAPYLLLATVTVLQAAGMVRTYPYYLSYYNPLMGGSKKAPDVMTIGWGEGLDQAASYLNAKPKARDRRVLVWYDTSFAPFFSGTTVPMMSTGAGTSDEVLEELSSAQYAVLYANQWQRHIPGALLDHLAQVPEQVIWIDGLEYARIYKLVGVPQAAPPSQPIENGNLDGVARLLGYDPPLPLQAAAGATLPLTLTWEAVGEFKEDYTVFIHLAGTDQVPVAQADGQPLGGAYATTLWATGERIADPYQLAIPADLLTGQYEVLVGMYLVSTGERLPVLAADGRFLGDSISLGSVQISTP